MTAGELDKVWPTLVVHEPDTANCPTCAAPVDGWSMNQPFREKRNFEPAWEGGPLIEVPSLYREEEPDGPPVWTVNPCGHRIGKIIRYETDEDSKLTTAAAVAAGLSFRDTKMRVLLTYCREESRSPNPDLSLAYDDVASRLAAILDGEA